MKIAFIHNRLIWYRKTLFMELSDMYDVDFLFTHENKVEDIEGINYIILNNYFGIAIGLILRLLKVNYDLIIVGGWSNISEFVEGIFCFVVAKIKRKPVILWLEHWYPPIPDIRRKLVSPLIKCIVKHSNACIAPGSKTKELYVKMDAKKDKIFIAPNASILEEKKNIDVRKILKIKERKIILYFSRVIPIKGLNYLIKAFSKLEKERDDIFLLICGEGDFICECKKLCNILNIKNVHFTGLIKPEDRYPYFSAANVFVLPTIFLNAHAEAWGLVINEAMSIGKPVISTTAVASAYDLIKNGINGFIVPEKDIDALYKSIKRILSDPKLEKKMGIESKKIIKKRFTYEHMVNGFKEAIERTIQREHRNNKK